MLERMEEIAPAHVDSPFRFRFIEPKKQPQHLLGLTDATLGYDQDVILGLVGRGLAGADRAAEGRFAADRRIFFKDN